ncbi:MAG: hypothetical protein NC200_00650 [Candidatus Gastranaerophilales bacterium]|nr:hypothetical protein [Candidatus Gastranaerophilales bacterium]
MTTSLWVILTLVTILCIVIFKKTVSNDAENDFKIRDVLSRPDVDEPEHIEEQFKSEPEPVAEFEQKIENFKKIQQEPVQEKLDCEYRTNVHEKQIIEEDLNESYQEESGEEKVFYDKEFSKEILKDKNIAKKKFGLFDYVRVFWRSITFTVGILVCLYSLFGILRYVQTSNDAIIYSIWLLIGVILIK